MHEITTPKSSSSDSTIALATVISSALKEGGDVLKMILQVGLTNGLFSAATMLIIVDILYNKKVLSKSGYYLITTIITAGLGVTIGAEVLSTLEDVLPFTGTIDKSIAIPTVTTLVVGNQSLDNAMNALLTQLKNK